MFRVFTGDNRVAAGKEVARILGKDYEVFDGENLITSDLYNICQGGSLFATTRKILIKDLTPAKKESATISTDPTTTSTSSTDSTTKSINSSDPYEIFGEFIDTPHEIIIWESTTPQHKSYRDFIKNQKVQYQKFEKPEEDKWASFRIFDIALVDGKRAVAELDRLLEKAAKGGEVKMLDPYSMVGALSTAAIKKFELHAGRKERQILKELSSLDIKLKSTTFDPWTLVKVFLLKVSTL